MIVLGTKNGEQVDEPDEQLAGLHVVDRVLREQLPTSLRRQTFTLERAPVCRTGAFPLRKFGERPAEKIVI